MNKGIDFIIMPKGYGRASKEVRDYITNLQQELEEEKRIEEADLHTIQELEENNKAMQEEMARTWQKCDDYKSRVEKAIEYIKNSYEELACKDTWYDDMDNLLNILEDKQ